MSTKITRLALLLLLTVASATAQTAPVDMRKRAEELTNLKWGMFICWSFSTFSEKAQLKELLTQYGPIEYIWFDHAIGDGGLSHADTLAFCKDYLLAEFTYPIQPRRPKGAM